MAKSTKSAVIALPGAQSGQAGNTTAPASPGPAAQTKPATGSVEPITTDNIEQRLSTLLQAGEADPAAASTEEPRGETTGQEPSPEEAAQTGEAAGEGTAAEAAQATIEGPATEAEGEAEGEGDDDPNTPEWAHKRIDKLTAQKYELKEEIEGLRAKVSELEGNHPETPASTAPASRSNPLGSVKSEAELQAKEAEAESLLDWVDDQLVTLRRNPDAVARVLKENKVELKDAEGEADYSRDAMEEFLLRTRRNLDKTVRVFVPQRRQHLQAAQQCDTAAAKAFPFLADRKAPEYALAKEVIAAYPGVQNRPDWKMFVGVHTLGLKAFRELQAKAKNGTNGASAKPRAIAPRATAAVAIPPAVDAGKVKVQQAREKMLKGGDPTDYIKAHLGVMS